MDESHETNTVSPMHLMIDAQGTGKAIQFGSYTYEVDELQAARPNHAHLKVKIINKINVPKCSRLCEKTCLATQLYRSANPEHRTVFKMFPFNSSFSKM